MNVLILYSCLICLVSAIRADVTYVLVEEGDTAEFKVNKTKDSLMKWIKGEGPKEEVLKDYGGYIISGYFFSCEGDACVMKIEDVQYEQAGRYEFRKIKSGKRHLTTFQLLVGDLRCSIKMKKHLIGKNDCHGVQADKVKRKCRLRYNGSRDYKPTIKWGVEGHKNDQVVEAVNVRTNGFWNVWEIKDIVVLDKAKVTYETNIIGSSVKFFFSPPPAYIQNAMNTTAPHLTHFMTSTNKRKLTCKANKSSNVQCSYKWVYYHNKPTEDSNLKMILTTYEGAELWLEDINKTGRYECHALCRLGNHHCTILADSFFFTPFPHFSISNILFFPNIHLESSKHKMLNLVWILIPIFMILIVVLLVFLLVLFSNSRSEEETEFVNRSAQELRWLLAVRPN